MKSEINTFNSGGGIHGVSLAYYLTANYKSEQIDVVLVERTGVASAASGKAGGFLAREWGNGPTIPLHKATNSKSF